MANRAHEFQGFRFRAVDLGSGESFAVATYDMGGAPGMADKSIEIQGRRVLAHDNGDGTFSVVTTNTTGAGDVTVEHQGLRFKLRPTGGTVPIGGLNVPTYAVVVSP